jgi:hypothetical protein
MTEGGNRVRLMNFELEVRLHIVALYMSYAETETEKECVEKIHTGQHCYVS